MDMKEKKKYLKKEISRFEEEKRQLLKQIDDIDGELKRLTNQQKPYVAVVQSYSGGGRASFETLEKATKKYEEYKSKTYFRNGLNYGVFLYKHNEDGTKEMIKEQQLERGYHSPDLTLDMY